MAPHPQPLSHAGASQQLSQELLQRLPNSFFSSPPLLGPQGESQPLSQPHGAATSQPQAGAVSQQGAATSQPQAGSQQPLLCLANRAASSPPFFLPQGESQPLSQPHGAATSQPQAGAVSQQGAATSQPHAGSAAQPHAGASQPQAGSAAQPQAGASQPQAGSAAQPQGASQPQAGSAWQPHGAAAQPLSQQEELLPFISFWSKSIP
ncbi:hypothetical protein [Stieleria mannarensis]|uniref:hypothetical protein n=1 Tax=Stieleria mannarensis TaxID=2755585 RepID=UPI0016049C3D|nr:hypothetical protein [Rhodopirellula sp. JC639]